MFRSARLKLTAWYLLIIMLICGFFSLLIYGAVTFELEARFQHMELRLHQRGMMIPPPGMARPPLFEEDLQTAKRRVLFVLLNTNGVILILSGIAGYFLAGKTLRPIEEALEEQKRFVSDASHELRTPLTALKTTMEVALREKKITKEQALGVLRSSLEDVDDLESLTSNLLSLAQNEKSNGNLVFEPVDLKQIVDNACKKVNPLASEKSIDLSVSTDDIVLEADEPSLEKLLVVLLDNAIKYTPQKGGVALTASQDKRHAFLSIADNGIGIDKSGIPHIFDRFYRIDQSRSKGKVPGFGLGLSMAKKIVDLHNGSIDASSLPGKGTTFTIKLPLSHS